MAMMVKSQEEVLSLINKIFGEGDTFEVESTSKEIIVRRVDDVVEKTKGTIKNLDIKIIKAIAESEEFCGY